MRHYRGVGIAAPQVGRAVRLCIIASRPSPRYPRAPRMKPLLMINPRLLAHSKRQVNGWEGCLSVPGIRGRVPRYQAVQVEFTNVKGEKVAMKLEGFVARIFQHEYDHLNGHVYLDRVRSARAIVSEEEYRAVLKMPGRR